jgi:tetratricopeptide (TPR) repeat protein
LKGLFDSKLDGSAFFIKLAVLLLSGVLFATLYGAVFTSRVRSNIAWVNLNKHFRGATSSPANDLSHDIALFSQAVNIDERNQSAWFGLGLSYVEQGDVDSAVSTWRQFAVDPEILIDYGMAARDGGDMDVALAFLRAAEYEGEITKASILAGTACQRSYADPQFLSTSNAQYCANYLTENDNNLIVNGDIAAGEPYGWEGQHFFSGSNSARLQIEDQGSQGNPAVRLIGENETNHFGLFQSVKLAPGDTVRFSGRFKIEGADNLSARLLYVGWRSEDGTPQGNHGTEQSGQMAWEEFERTFRVPENVKSAINFYPLIFSGEGTLWFDDIKVELVSD